MEKSWSSATSVYYYLGFITVCPDFLLRVDCDIPFTSNSKLLGNILRCWVSATQAKLYILARLIIRWGCIRVTHGQSGAPFTRMGYATLCNLFWSAEYQWKRRAFLERNFKSQWVFLRSCLCCGNYKSLTWYGVSFSLLPQLPTRTKASLPVCFAQIALVLVGESVSVL